MLEPLDHFTIFDLIWGPNNGCILQVRPNQRAIQYPKQDILKEHARIIKPSFLKARPVINRMSTDKLEQKVTPKSLMESTIAIGTLFKV